MKTENKMEEVIKILKKRNWTIGVMESCTGGAVVNCITNIPGASDVFDEGRVTYSSEAKIRAGVDEKIIQKYGVYSIETAEEMARKATGDLGVGVTGNLNFPEEVFVGLRVKDQVKSIKFKVQSKNKNETEARKEKKEQVVERVVEMITDNL